MSSYVPSTKKQREEMLKTIGVSSVRDLYQDVPNEVLLQHELNLPDEKSEMEVIDWLGKKADKNKVYRSILRGAGAYHHFIPSIVSQITSKEEFVTAYTPYQAEISQGVLQSIFEYQTIICELTGMDVSNASVYDGAVAAAEAVGMCRNKKTPTVYVSEGVHPEVLKTIQTYCWAANTEVKTLPLVDGKTDVSSLEEGACLYLQNPNYYGVIEDAKAIGEVVHEKGMKFILGMEPFSMMLLPSPREVGADIAVGEGQPLGMPLSFGGPYLGFMATTKDMMRHLPGRIVGETADDQGRKAYVLTLQAREQHIRREKASSNICSNEAHCALTAAVYCSAMGPEGLKDVAVQSYSKAHYFAKALVDAGMKLRYDSDFFNEFVMECENPEEIVKRLEEKNILAGLPIEKGILWCVTETTDKETLDEVVKEVTR